MKARYFFFSCFGESATLSSPEKPPRAGGDSATRNAHMVAGLDADSVVCLYFLAVLYCDSQASSPIKKLSLSERESPLAS